MDDLGHFEFGTGHRPIAFPGFDRGGDPYSLGYWLDYWRASYEHVLATLPENAWLLDYDMACEDEAAMDAALARIAGVVGERTGAPALKVAEPRDAEAGGDALAVHGRLRAHLRNVV